MNIAALLVLVGLRGGNGKADVAIQLAHGQLRYLSHGRVALLDTNEKIGVWFFQTVGNQVVTFKAPVRNNQRLWGEIAALQHGE